MAEHYVWFHALRDILMVVAIPDLSHAKLALLSPEVLKRRAVLAARVDYAWRQRITPKVRIVNISSSLARVVKAKLMPGGDWLVNLLSDGTLCLQAVTSNVPCVIDPSFRTENPDVRMTLSLSATNETLVLLRTWSWDNSVLSPSITVGLYRVDTVTPCFQLLMKTTRHHGRAYENSIAAEGNLWAFSWSSNSHQLLSVRNIPITGEIEKEAVIDIGLPIHATLSILSERHVLVTSCTRTALYNIPTLEPVTAGGNLRIVAVEPVWERTYEDRYNYPPVSPIYWTASNRRHEGPLALFTGRTLRFFHHTDDELCYFSSYPLPHFKLDSRPTLSDRRVLWREKGGLYTCVFPVTYGKHYDTGRQRLGYKDGEFEIPHVVPIDLGTTKIEGKIGDISWDETSGRLCMLFEKSSVKNGSRLLIADRA
jgi:hypothetical protein